MTYTITLPDGSEESFDTYAAAKAALRQAWGW